MNAKKAKALRKLLENLINMNTGAKLQVGKYVENQAARKMIQLDTVEIDEKTGLETKVPKTFVLASGTIRNAKDSVRGVYLMLKKELNKIEGSRNVKSSRIIQDLESVEVKAEKAPVAA